MENQDPLAGMEKAKRPQIKFGKVGDWIKGTIVANEKEIENSLSTKTPKEMQLIVEFKIHGGSFHDIVDKVAVAEPTIPEKGSFWSLFAKGMVKDQLKRAKIGQIVGVRFKELKPATRPGFNDTKIIDVLYGEMDSEYQGEQLSDLS